jgi:hypothetical protein
MKNYLQDNYPENIIYDKLRIVVKDTWEKIGEYKFRILIENIPIKCQTVIDVNNFFTKY